MEEDLVTSGAQPLSDTIQMECRRLAGSTLCLLIACGCVVGCRPASPTESQKLPVAVTEPLLADQIASVRRGELHRVHTESHVLTADDWRRLAGLEGLREILADGGRLTDADSDSLRSCASLEHLRVRGPSIGDAGFAVLGGLPRLAIINLPDAQVTDQGLGPLVDCQKLIQLRLGGPHLTSACCERLAALKQLKFLHLIQVPVDDAGVLRLAALPQLQSLYLDGSSVTSEGWSRFYELRPDVHVHVDQSHRDGDPNRHAHP
jgi:hypothetical protein